MAQQIRFSDCSPYLEASKETAQVVQAFKTLSEYFAASSKDDKDDDDPVLSLRTTFNDVEKKYETRWWAGRYIGLANIQVDKKKGNGKDDVQISIRPRFGEAFLLKIIEDVYKIRQPQNNADTPNISSDEWFSALMNLLRRKMWVEKCAKANRYGLPRLTTMREHQGASIKGALDIKRTLMPWMMKKEVCSYTFEKAQDDKICQIVYEAHRILSRNVIDNRVGKKRKKAGGPTPANVPSSFSVPPAVKDTIDALNREYKGRPFCITDNEYRRIRYKSIYLSWKPLVDFSWSVIKGHRLGFHASEKQTECVFVDMAEIWETYLRKKLGEHLKTDGWRVWTVVETEKMVYDSTFFKRRIIPDIVLQRKSMVDGKDEFLVFDAKYKRMSGHKDDVDRSDFFQIHTYIQYFQHTYPEGRVLLGGLLYPLSKEDWKENRPLYTASTMFGSSGRFETKFIIDGVLCSETNDQNGNNKLTMEANVEAMFKRIKGCIESF